MWTLAIPSLLLLFNSIEATDPCATCTSNYNGTNDTDCSSLKTYLSCLDNATITTPCALSDEVALKIKNANCTPSLPQGCRCQKDFWGTNGTHTDKCTALTTYVTCLNQTTVPANSTCNDGVSVSTLLTSPNSSKAACEITVCSPRPCKNGGKCDVTEGGSNYTCDCASGYSGRVCDEGPCVRHTCSNHGKCKADDKDQTKPLCVCDADHTGDQCQNAAAASEISLPSFLATLLVVNIIKTTLT
ncbi:fibropellin-3-like [Haliotis asinina]|uniref:fibropellin-3-like n=1 Tax=Haliotis asinina TaxID=109174 RepID=UPI0035327B59